MQVEEIEYIKMVNGERFYGKEFEAVDVPGIGPCLHWIHKGGPHDVGWDYYMPVDQIAMFGKKMGSKVASKT